MAERDDGGGFFLLAILLAAFAWFAGLFGPKKAKDQPDDILPPSLPRNNDDADKKETTNQTDEQQKTQQVNEVTNTQTANYQYSASIRSTLQNFQQEKLSLENEVTRFLAENSAVAILNALKTKLISARLAEYQNAVVEAAKTKATPNEFETAKTSINNTFSTLPQKVQVVITKDPSGKIIDVSLNDPTIQNTTNATSGTTNKQEILEIEPSKILPNASTEYSTELNKKATELNGKSQGEIQALTAHDNSQKQESQPGQSTKTSETPQSITLDFSEDEVSVADNATKTIETFSSAEQEKQRAEEKIEKDKVADHQEALEAYDEAFPKNRLNGQVAITNLAAPTIKPQYNLGGQFDYAYRFLDLNNRDFISKKTAGYYSGIYVHLGASLRPGVLYNKIPIGDSDQFSFSRPAILNSNITAEWNPTKGKEPLQLYAHFGPSAKYSSIMEHYSEMYGGVGCGCTGGMCDRKKVFEDINDKNNPLTTPVHAPEGRLQREFLLSYGGGIKTNNFNIYAGYKPENNFIERNLSPFIAGSLITSETYAASASYTVKNEDFKPYQIISVSYVNRPQAGIYDFQARYSHKFSDKALFSVGMEDKTARDIGNNLRRFQVVNSEINLPITDKTGNQRGVINFNASAAKAFGIEANNFKNENLFQFGALAKYNLKQVSIFGGGGYDTGLNYNKGFYGVMGVMYNFDSGKNQKTN